MYALADCNNFFVSCERVFRPDLNGRPVIVLSNNDGCAVARSNEAKALGIKMGDPLFKIRDIVREHKVAVFSGNMALYGDMSNRVRQTLREFVPYIEVYSIDEAFLDLKGMDHIDYDAFAKEVSRRCLRNTAIPVSVGVAPTKTLAKIASKLCKKYPKLRGGCYMHRTEDIEKVLRKFPVDDVWGIGRRSLVKLYDLNVRTAYDFTQLPGYQVNAMMGVGGLRTWKELQGEPCITIDQAIAAKQTIANTRSFSSEITSLEELAEQVANFAAMTAEKLRAQGSACSELFVFARTNRFKEGQRQAFDNVLVTFPEPTASTRALVSAALDALRELFVRGRAYKSAGVAASGIVPLSAVQGSLFSSSEGREKEARLMSALDAINRSSGPGAVRIASQGSAQIRSSHDHQSPHFTTRWSDIPVIYCR